MRCSRVPDRPVARGGGGQGGQLTPTWTLEVRSKTETTRQFTVQVSISGLLYIVNKNMLKKAPHLREGKTYVRSLKCSALEKVHFSSH